jgi:hypothetical protein
VRDSNSIYSSEVKRRSLFASSKKVAVRGARGDDLVTQELPLAKHVAETLCPFRCIFIHVECEGLWLLQEEVLRMIWFCIINQGFTWAELSE